MHIVHVTPHAQPRAGDVRAETLRRVVMPLAKAQAALGESVEIYSPPRHQGADIAGAIGLAVMSLRLPRLMHRLGANVVHIHGDHGTASIAAWACRRKRVPYVLTVLDEQEFQALKRRTSKRLAGGAKRLLAGARKLFVLDPLSLDAVRHACGDTVPVALLPLCIEPIEPPSPPELRADSPFTANATPKLVLTGLHEPATERRAFLDEFARPLLEPLKLEYPRLQAVVLCEFQPRHMKAFEHEVREAGLDGFVQLLPCHGASESVERRDRTAYAEADAVFVYASSPSIIARLDVLHAWAAGRPLVAAGRDSMRELIDDGRTGRIVGANNPQALQAAAREALAPNGLGPLLAQQGREQVEQFYAPRRAATELLTHYRRAQQQ